MKVAVRALLEECPRCKRAVMPYMAVITREGVILYNYRCTCGRGWESNKTPDIRVTVIGEEDILRLRERPLDEDVRRG